MTSNEHRPALVTMVCAAMLACAVDAKVFDVTLTLNSLRQTPARYLTKFRYYTGGEIILEVKPELAANSFLNGLNMSLGMLTHEEYVRMEELKSCQDKIAVSTNLINLELKENITLRIEQNVTEKSNAGEYVYLVVFACKLTPRYPSTKAKFHFLLELRNQGTHFSAGDETMMEIYGVFAIVFACVFTFMVKNFYIEMIKKSSNETNYAYIIVNACVLLKLISLLMDLVDIYLFSQDGLGFAFLTFLSQVCNHISQYILVVLLVFLAKGWTLIFDDISEFELFLPISVVVGIFKVIIIGLGKLEDNSPFFFHRYDSFVGWIITAVNVSMWVYFIYEGLETLAIIGPNSKTSHFVKNLLAFGSLYFALFPGILLGSLWLAPESRWKLIEMGRLFSQLIALAFMGYVTGSKKGTYKEIAIFETGIQLPSIRDDDLAKLKSEKEMK